MLPSAIDEQCEAETLSVVDWHSSNWSRRLILVLLIYNSGKRGREGAFCSYKQ